MGIWVWGDACPELGSSACPSPVYPDDYPEAPSPEELADGCEVGKCTNLLASLPSTITATISDGNSCPAAAAGTYSMSLLPPDQTSPGYCAIYSDNGDPDLAVCGDVFHTIAVSNDGTWFFTCDLHCSCCARAAGDDITDLSDTYSFGSGGCGSAGGDVTFS